MQHSVRPRISNGQNASSKQFPFFTSIQYSYLKLIPYIHLCCGVAIDKYWILSSAVCVKAIKGIGIARAVIGVHFASKEEDGVQAIKIEHKIVHEDFDDSRKLKKNDIGLLKLKAQISEPVLAKLPQSEDSAMGQVTMIGWGLVSENVIGSVPKVLQYAIAKIINNGNCERVLYKAGPNIIVDDSMVCSWAPGKSITACDGDSGGPLVKYINEEPVVEGIISWTPCPCGEVDLPTVSMRVFNYVGWINRKMRELINQKWEEPKTSRKIQTNTDDLLTPLLTTE